MYSSCASLAEGYYLKDEEEKKALNKAIWDDVEQKELDNIDRHPEINPSDILFTYDDKEWTIKEFNDLLRSHPSGI